MNDVVKKIYRKLFFSWRSRGVSGHTKSEKGHEGEVEGKKQKGPTKLRDLIMALKTEWKKKGTPFSPFLYHHRKVVINRVNENQG